jgi:hypothetical protein
VAEFHHAATLDLSPLRNLFVFIFSVSCHLAIIYIAFDEGGKGAFVAAPNRLQITLVRTPDRNIPPQEADEHARPQGTDVATASAPSDLSAVAQAAQSLPVKTTPYFSIAQLTSPPHALMDVQANLADLLPLDFRSVVVSLLIDEDGKTDEATIEDASLPEPVRQVIQQAFQKMRFSPGMVGDVAVRSKLEIELTINAPDGSGAN